MARVRTTPRHTAAPARSTEEHHSVFEDRSVLDALWSAVVAAPTSVMPPMPDAPEPDAPEKAADLAAEPSDQPNRPSEQPAPAEPAGAAGPGAAGPGAAGPGAAGPGAAAPAAPAATAAPPAHAGTTAPAAPAAAQAAARAATAAPPPFEPVLGRPVFPAGLPGMAPPHHPAPATSAPERATAPPPTDHATTAGHPAAAGNPAEHPPRATGPFDLSYAAPPATNRTIWAGPRHAAPHDWNSLSALLTIETPTAVADAGLLVLRLVIGLTMAAHGAQKAFGAFGGDGFSATADGFSALGYQPGALFALAAIIGELFGGLLLAVGLLTPLAAGGIIGVTVNAMVAVNLGNGFFATNNGIELPLILSGAALGLLVTGPGRYAADARIPFCNGAAVQCAAAAVALVALLASLGAHLI